MASSYNADSVHRLLRALLGPIWGERKAADSHLLALMTCVPPEGNPALMQLIDDATNRFDYQEEAFFRELTQFWMETCAQAYAARMRTFALEPLADDVLWPARESKREFPMRGAPMLDQFDTYGLGTGWYLCTQARRLTFQTDTIIRGLTHPEPTVVNTCWKLLGSIPRQARAALAPMLNIAFRKGPRFAPDSPMRWLAAIFDAHPEEKATLVAALSEPAEDHRAPVVAALAQHMAMVPPELFSSLLRRLDFLKDPEQRFSVMRAAAEIAQHDRAGPGRLVLRRAEKLLSSPEPADRGGAAWGLAYLGTPALNEPQLLALLHDADWMPRSDAAAAVAHWATPSPTLVSAVANLLGDYEGYDGQPHDNAVETLIGWRTHAAPSAPRIAEWIVADLETEPPSAETIWRVVDALGDAGATALRPAVNQFVEAYERNHTQLDTENTEEQDDAPNTITTLSGERVERGGMTAALAEALADALNQAQADIDARMAAHESDQLNMTDLLYRAGINPQEDVPGTPTQAELAAKVEPITKIKRWLQQPS